MTEGSVVKWADMTVAQQRRTESVWDHVTAALTSERFTLNKVKPAKEGRPAMAHISERDTHGKDTGRMMWVPVTALEVVTD